MSWVGVREAHHLLRWTDLIVVVLLVSALERRVSWSERIRVGGGSGRGGGRRSSFGGRGERETVDVLSISGGDASESVGLLREEGAGHLLIGGVGTSSSPDGVGGFERSVVGRDG